MELIPIFELDRGGMGSVSVAARVEGEFRRFFAVKRLLPELVRDEAQRKMFLEEARIAGALSHPNVVPVIDVGVDEKGPYLVMEYVEGASAAVLLQAIRREGRTLSIAHALLLCRDVARGLSAAHQAKDSMGTSLNLVHRDVSPQNVLIDFSGRARITDFGIARAAGRDQKTRTGVLKGKLGYMSPEQLRFESVDQRSDLFSLGVVIYELASGIRLYAPGEDGREGARRILNEAPPDLGEHCPEAPPALVKLVLDLLTKERDERLASAAEVVGILDELCEDWVEAGDGDDLAALMGRLFGEQRDALSQQFSQELRGLERRSAIRRKAVWATLLMAGAGAVAAVVAMGWVPPVDEAPAPPSVESPPPMQVLAAPVEEARTEVPTEVEAPAEPAVRRTPRSARRRRRPSRMAPGDEVESAPSMATAPVGSPSPSMVAGTWGWEDR